MGRHSNYPKKAGIYKFTCNNNGKVYIGKAVDINKRISNHKYSSKASEGKCYFQNAMIKYGWDSFTIEILEIVENFDKLKDNESLLERESYYIEMFNSTDRDKGYNSCKHSNDSTGRKMTEESKEKLRQKKLGFKHTEESKEKMRKPRTAEHIANTIKGRAGYKHSEETKEKIRQKQLGRKYSDESKEKMRLRAMGNTSRLKKKHPQEIGDSELVSLSPIGVAVDRTLIKP